MESLSEVLERADVKTYLQSFKLRETHNIQNNYQRRFSLLFTNSLWQKAFEYKALESVRKEHDDMNENMIVVLSAAYSYSGAMDFHDYFISAIVYKHYFKQIRSWDWYKRQINLLHKRGYIFRGKYHWNPIEKISPGVPLRIKITGKAFDGPSTLYRLTTKSRQVIKSYDRSITTLIGKAAREFGNFRDARLNVAEQLLNHYFALNPKYDITENILLRDRIQNYVDDIIKETEG